MAKPKKKAPAKRGAGRPARKERDERPEREEREPRGRRKSKTDLDFQSYKVKGFEFGDLEVTEVRLALTDNGAVRALGSITLNRDFSVGGLRVVEDGRKGGGLFVSMPQRKTEAGEYKDTSFPLTKEGRETITEAVLDAYDQAGGK